jgi:hypothetical protein
MPSRRCLLVIALCALVFAGCSSPPPLDRKVAAATGQEFSSWQMRNREDFPPDQWSEFEAALQEIKLHIISLKEATGGDEVNDALRPKIHQHTVREVLQQGYEARLWRLNVERTELDKMLEQNATLRTRPGDTASASYLEHKHQQQTEQHDKVVAEIRATEQKLAALGGTPKK